MLMYLLSVFCIVFCRVVIEIPNSLSSLLLLLLIILAYFRKQHRQLNHPNNKRSISLHRFRVMCYSADSVYAIVLYSVSSAGIFRRYDNTSSSSSHNKDFYNFQFLR